MWKTECDPAEPDDTGGKVLDAGGETYAPAEGLGGVWGPPCAESANVSAGSACFAVARNRYALVAEPEMNVGRFGGGPAEKSLFSRNAPPAGRGMGDAPHLVRTIGVFLDQSWQERRGGAESGNSLLASLGVRRPTSLGERGGIGGGALRGIRALADRRDWRLLLFPSAIATGTDPGDILHRLRENGISGLILGPGYADVHASRLADAGLPVVLLMQETDIPDSFGSVVVREEQLVGAAMNHLWERGHRRIACFSEYNPGAAMNTDGQAGAVLSSSIVTQRRFSAYTAFLNDRRALLPGLHGFASGPCAEQQVAEALERWKKLPQPPTAVFCSGEESARVLAKAARRVGVSVPDDLSVVAVDTEDGQFARTELPLTSVEIPAEQIGREATRLLLAMLADGGSGLPRRVEELRVTVPARRVVERGSVRPVR